MQLTQTKLAKLWGVSRVAVHHLVKKGMPLTSISDAEDWRDANTRNQRGGRASDKANSLPDTPEATEKKAARIRQAATVEEAERYLAEVEELRNFAKENAETLWQQGLADDSRKWLTVHQAIAKQYPSLHSQVLKLREAHRVTITTQDVKAAIGGFMARWANHIERMPSALSAKCNPSDPDHALGELTRWVEGVFKIMSQVPTFDRE